MDTVYKYHLQVTDQQVLQLPPGAKFLKALPNPFGPAIDVWFKVTDVAPSESRTFRIVGTGHPLPKGTFVRYLDTVRTDALYVWHIFEEED